MVRWSVVGGGEVGVDVEGLAGVWVSVGTRAARLVLKVVGVYVPAKCILFACLIKPGASVRSMCRPEGKLAKSLMPKLFLLLPALLVKCLSSSSRVCRHVCCRLDCVV